MMIKRWFIGFLSSLLLVGIVSAQDTVATQPLVLVKAGDLWEWTGGPTLRQKTQWGYNNQLVLSPLNNEVAYSSLPQIVIDYLESRQGGGDGAIPSNLWVITTASTDEAYRIADQPADAAYSNPNTPDNILYRANPIWSPDGTQIAWVETDSLVSTTYRLMVYDKTSQTVRTLASDLPQQMGLGFYFGGAWTDKGLVMFSNAITPDGRLEVSYMLFDPETGEKKFDLAANPITVKDDTLRPQQALPIQYQDRTWLGVLYVGQKAGARWQMIDLDAGQFTGETANIIGYASGHAETSLRVIPVVPLNQPVMRYVVQQANGANVQFSDDPNKQIMRFSLSPDGSAIAYQLYTPGSGEVDYTVYIWRDGVISVVPQTEHPAIISDFVWGSITWEVGGEGPGIGAVGS